MNEPRILKVASCPSLSGRTTLTYHVGTQDDRNVCFRIWKTSGKGVFSKEWTSAFDIHSVLADHESLAAPLLLPIFKRGRSVNTAGFLMAVLRNEGLVKQHPDISHHFFAAPSETFVQEMSALIESGASLDADATVESTSALRSGKARGRAAVASTVRAV